MVRVAVMTALVALLCAAACLPAQAEEPFGVPLKEVFVSHAGSDLGWKAALQDIEGERLAIAKCRLSEENCPEEIRESAKLFIEIVDRADAQAGVARVGWLNRDLNGAFKRMEEGCHSAGKWTAPLETLREGCGDCKEYALAKAVGLLELGFAPDDVRVVAGYVPSQFGVHAITAVRFEDHWLVLNNFTNTLVPADELPNFEALYTLAIPGPTRPQAGS